VSETTLVKLPAGGGVFDESNLDAIQAMIAAQNLNNTSLRAGITACATTPVPSSQLDPSTIQYASIALSLAKLLALHATPPALVAAQGAGTLVEFVSAVLEYHYGSAAFTIGTAGNLTIAYKADASGGAASGTLAATGFFDQTATQLASFLPAALPATAATTLLNQPLVLSLATADMTVGTGGSGTLKIAYRVHTGL
jgi:hypothetical protein